MIGMNFDVSPRILNVKKSKLFILRSCKFRIAKSF